VGLAHGGVQHITGSSIAACHWLRQPRPSHCPAEIQGPSWVGAAGSMAQAGNDALCRLFLTRYPGVVRIGQPHEPASVTSPRQSQLRHSSEPRTSRSGYRATSSHWRSGLLTPNCSMIGSEFPYFIRLGMDSAPNFNVHFYLVYGTIQPFFSDFIIPHIHCLLSITVSFLPTFLDAT